VLTGTGKHGAELKHSSDSSTTNGKLRYIVTVFLYIWSKLRLSWCFKNIKIAHSKATIFKEGDVCLDVKRVPSFAGFCGRPLQSTVALEVRCFDVARVVPTGTANQRMT
jgi:hypothetical protein